jgi:hypothetical protein
MSRRPLRVALLRLIPLLLLLVLIALISPLTLVLLLGLSIAAFLLVLPILRKRGPQPPVYRRPHRQFPPPGLLSQEQRRKQQWLLLIGFLLGTPISRLPLLSESSAATLQQIPLLRRLTKRCQLHSLPAGILLSLLVLLLLFDDTLVCYGRYLFSLVFGVLTGYGYKLTRIISSYLVVVLGFAALYYVIGHLAPLETLTFSFISFHGYGFFPGNNVLLSKPMAVLAIIEAAIGFFIEVCFIAACISRFIQR